MLHNQHNNRATIEEGFNSLDILIPARRNWAVIIVLCVWMCGWVLGELFALSILFGGDSPLAAHLFLVVWGCAWTAGGVLVVYQILWQLIGRELIRVTRQNLVVGKSVWGIGRKKRYELHSITNLGVNLSLGNASADNSLRSRNRARKQGTIKFDYRGATIECASDIDSNEAEMLIEKLRRNGSLKAANFAESGQKQGV